MGQEPTPEGGQEPQSTAAPESSEPAEAKTYDEAYVKQLRGEAAANRKKASELEARMRELEDRDKSDSQKLQEERDRLRSEVDPVKTENLRLRVALSKNLPADLIDRLRGGTEEELAADADKLLELFKPEEESAVTFDGGARQPAPVPSDMNALIRRSAGRAS